VRERPLVKSLAAEQTADAALGVLSHFRVQFYDCLYTRADALFELTDAVLCSDGPVTSLVELTLTAEHRRGHGAMYDTTVVPPGTAQLATVPSRDARASGAFPRKPSPPALR
jgi:hypothetical protein